MQDATTFTLIFKITLMLQDFNININVHIWCGKVADGGVGTVVTVTLLTQVQPMALPSLYHCCMTCCVWRDEVWSVLIFQCCLLRQRGGWWGRGRHTYAMQWIDLVIALKKCKSFMKQKYWRMIALTLVEAAIAKTFGKSMPWKHRRGYCPCRNCKGFRRSMSLKHRLGYYF